MIILMQCLAWVGAGIMSDWGEGFLCGRAEQGKRANRKCDVVCEERLAKP